MSHETTSLGLRGLRCPLREQGLAAVPGLAMYAHIKKIPSGSLLVQINHPASHRTLLLVADKNKPSLQRVAKLQ